jgi:ABC-type multidrug transport system ATPase subunit
MIELVCENLGRNYGKLWALRGLNLRCGAGLIGLVGPNGAGKTTFLRMVSTLLPPSEGAMYWNGLDIQKYGTEVRQTLGYLPQDFGLYPEFSARRFLQYMAAMKGLPRDMAGRRVDEVLEMVNLEREANRKLRGYSGGMKQRIGIAQALLNDPELLIVDEPTAGLDPEERVRFRTLLATFTVNRLLILSTHIISDVEATAGRLLLLREGKLLADTTPEELLSNAVGKVWSVTTDTAQALDLQARYQVSGMISQRAGINLRILSLTRPVENAEIIDPTLEDAYLIAIGSKIAAQLM